ncbi:MAG: glycosyltransferase family 4 protein [Planctomycetota bacterium]
MKILHIFSDWKWTGPSEPILNLCSALIKSGEIVHIACLAPPVKSSRVQEFNSSTVQQSDRTLPLKAEQAGIKTLLLSPLPKYFPFLAMRQNIKKLAGYISEHNFDIIHCHSSMDHFYAAAILAGLPSPVRSVDSKGNEPRQRSISNTMDTSNGVKMPACPATASPLERPVMSSLGKLLFSPLLLYFLTGHAYRIRRHHLPTPMLRQASKNIKIIRTNHKGFPLELSHSNKFLLKYATDGYIALSKKLAEIDCKNFSLAPETVAAISGAVDVIKVRSSEFGVRSSEVRGRLGLKESDVVIGVVARVQRHRRFKIIIEAMRLVVKEMPLVKLVIIGRGTHYDELVTRPVKELNLGDNVISAGYRSSDDDYFDIINVFDFGIYLVPGSDGSCRAALELMASGKPLIVARRGVLPEIVDDNRSGLVIDDTPENLAQAILRLANDKELISGFSQQARLKMTNEFSPELSVKATTDFYHNILRSHRTTD